MGITSVSTHILRPFIPEEYCMVSLYLLVCTYMKDLTELGFWNGAMKNKLIAAKGSVQGITEIPQNIKDLYKTV